MTACILQVPSPLSSWIRITAMVLNLRVSAGPFSKWVTEWVVGCYGWVTDQWVAQCYGEGGSQGESRHAIRVGYGVGLGLLSGGWVTEWVSGCYVVGGSQSGSQSVKVENHCTTTVLTECNRTGTTHTKRESCSQTSCLGRLVSIC